MKVLIAVTHLLGAGHLSRAVTLARAFSDAGHEVTVLSGGRAAPHLDMDGLNLVQLPPLTSDGTNFTRLLDEDGQVADETYLAKRTAGKVETLRALSPDVLIIELFPFGRRSLSGEFLALLQAAGQMRPEPLVLASIRDILAPPSKPSKADRARDILLEHYDGVLVHSDPKITRLEDSWPVAEVIQPLLHYTGYVAPPPAAPHPTGVGQGEIIVSAGGGAVGQALFECAVEAARQSPLSWRLLVGGAERNDRIAELAARAGDLEITIEPVRPDFREMLTGAAASVSMCGYNTALDLLQTGLPAVLVPFDDGGEVEQSLRARALAALPAVDVISTAELTPEAMAAAVDTVMSEGRRSGDGLAMRGAQDTVEIVEDLLGKMRK
ncbi:glycosyltransferase family protein [Shimia sp. W99]